MSVRKSFDNPGTLMLKTHALLKSDPRNISDISIDTGVSFFWLQRFSAMSMKNPSVNRVQYLYEQLTNTILKIK